MNEILKNVFNGSYLNFFEISAMQNSSVQIILLILFEKSLLIIKHFPILDRKYLNTTAKRTKISPNFLMCKFCRNAQFPQSYGWFIHKTLWRLCISTKFSIPRNWVKLVFYAVQRDVFRNFLYSRFGDLHTAATSSLQRCFSTHSNI